MKKKAIIAASLAAALFVTGCSSVTETANPQKTDESQQTAVSEEADAPDGAGIDADIEQIISRMSLREKVEQRMLVAFRNLEESAKPSEDPDKNKPVRVTQLSDRIKDNLKEHNYGGMLLFGDNFSDPKQTLSLISDIQKTNQDGGGLPMLITVDQEGGNVARINFGTSGVGNMALTATSDPENAKKMARIYGEELRLLGINTDHAPVVDVNNNPKNPVIGQRSFSDSPETVAEYALSYMEGLHEEGIIACLKHFPGHGNTDTDSHTGFPRIDSTYDELKEFELIPFKQAIDAGADMVMSAHIQYPKIEDETYTSISSGEEVYIPATMSHKILTGILRDDLGFEGVIVTDALDMKAIADNFAPEDVMCKTMNAGADLIMLPAVQNQQVFDEMNNMVEIAVKLAEDGKISEESIDDSVRRILKLKKKYGILDMTDFTVTDEEISAAQAGVGSDEHRQTAWDLANEALTIVKNDNNAFPVSGDDKTLILFSDSCASCAGNGELVRQKLKDEKKIPDESRIEVMTVTKDNEKDCIKAAEDADHTIIVSATSSAANLDPDSDDGFSTGVFDKVIEKLHKDGRQVILVSCRLPYDAARFDADAILLAYNVSTMKVMPPASGEGSAYAPNLAAALIACFGKVDINGCLPVDIPEIDDKYEFTDKILYRKGTNVILGDEQFDEYTSMLENKRVALFSNQTGIVGDDIASGKHILDALIEHGVDVTAIFSPEHGFRGKADAGENVNNSVDEKTGVPILSLYQSNSHYPSKEDMDKFDTLVVDIQDVGLRYYTYYISMYYLMDACASSGKDVIILDRPNPNGFYVDGPILKDEYKSGVGKLPIPVVHGMTLGELARMINGEGWLEAGKDACNLTVIPCLNYTHDTKTELVTDPSPNLKDMRAIYLYASTCFFENTYVSVGRGTDMPFEVYGSPFLSKDKNSFSFTPKSMEGAIRPPFENETCYGRDLRDLSFEEIWEKGINLEYLISAYNDFHEENPDLDFFAMQKNGDKYWIDLLSGSDDLRKQICAGKSAEEIKASWQDDIESFKEQRKQYLLYE